MYSRIALELSGVADEGECMDHGNRVGMCNNIEKCVTGLPLSCFVQELLLALEPQTNQPSTLTKETEQMSKQTLNTLSPLSTIFFLINRGYLFFHAYNLGV